MGERHVRESRCYADRAGAPPTQRCPSQIARTGVVPARILGHMATCRKSPVLSVKAAGLDEDLATAGEARQHLPPPLHCPRPPYPGTAGGRLTMLKFSEIISYNFFLGITETTDGD